MQLSLSPTQLVTYVTRQLDAVMPDVVSGCSSADAVARTMPRALERLEHCLMHSHVKYFRREGAVWFDHRHTDQYAALLYLLSHVAWREQEDVDLAARLYALNKALHALDVFYEVALPPVFGFQHPVGTVLGRATYGDYFYVYQRCSVGSAIDGVTPTIGRGVVMFGGSSIIGHATVGDNVWLSVGSTVLDAEVPNDSVVFGTAPHHVVKPTRRDVVRDIFKDVA